MARDYPSKRQDWRGEQVIEAMKGRAVRTVLEVGTEHGWTGKALRDAFPGAAIRAIEIWPAYVELCRERGWYDAIACGDAIELLPAIRGPVDLAIACDVIEHLHTGDAVNVLAEMARIGKVAIVAMPIGWQHQSRVDGNPYQEHKSAWTPAEMSALGWQTLATSERWNLAVYGWGFTS